MPFNPPDSFVAVFDVAVVVIGELDVVDVMLVVTDAVVVVVVVVVVVAAIEKFAKKQEVCHTAYDIHTKSLTTKVHKATALLSFSGAPITY